MPQLVNANDNDSHLHLQEKFIIFLNYFLLLRNKRLKQTKIFELL